MRFGNLLLLTVKRTDDCDVFIGASINHLGIVVEVAVDFDSFDYPFILSHAACFTGFARNRFVAADRATLPI